MSDPTNRYRIPAKRAAYEEALQVAATVNLQKPGAFQTVFDALHHYNLSYEHTKQAASQALRVERWRRREREAEVIT